MKMKSIALALALCAGSALTVPVASAQAVKGIAVANPSAIVASSSAYQTAQAQRPTTYKPQIDAANTRKAQIEAQLKPLYDKLEADAKAPNADRAKLQAQAVQIQQIEQAGEREIQAMLEPLNLSQQYVLEQIGDKLEAATQAAMNKQKVTLILDSQSVVKADQTYNINQAILNELNAAIPSAQLVPPAGWKPRQQREAEAAAAAQAAQQQPPATQAPAGR